ncbi:MAG TPA: lysine transporter LysE [Janthinobacterium sp.]|nr:lysine transporter LysE [Janthinobacterium sp.]
MLEPLLPLAMYAFVASITPGPNNIMLTSSGIRFGFLRSIPHMLGVTAGFGVMLALCAVGIGSLVLALPSMHIVLKAIGSAYLLYLAWQLRSMALQPDKSQQGRPMSFLAAAAFQAVNPKAWIMAITGASAFLPQAQSVWLAIGVFCLVFCSVNLPCISLWAGSGAMLRRYLDQAVWRRTFCVVMVALTLYSALAVWL